MAAYVGGILGLYRVDLSTRTATTIVAAPSPGGVSTSAVSPNGDVIAAPIADAEGWKIWLIQLDGSGSAVLPGSIDAFDPQWSPDASRIVFVQGFRPYVHELATGTATRIIDTQVISLAWYP
jgi:Tol biopolymer transport system component